MAETLALTKLSDLLWQDEGDVVYAVLDGAAITNLIDRLYAPPRPEFACLFRGELAPDMAEVSPYLVRLERDSEWLPWIAAGWGNAWGLLVVAPGRLDLGTVRRHLRKLNLVTLPDGNTAMFRYYDPRVLRRLLPLADAEQVRQIFGPLGRIVVEAESAGECHVFALARDGALTERILSLTH